MTYDSSEAEKITGRLRRRPGPPTESSEPRAKVNAEVSIKIPLLRVNRALLWLEPQRGYVAFRQSTTPEDAQSQPFCLLVGERSKQFFSPLLPSIFSLCDWYMQVVKHIPLGKNSQLTWKGMFSLFNHLMKTVVTQQKVRKTKKGKRSVI